MIAKSRTAPFRQVQRARALLLAADGVANARIAEQAGVSVATVRSRFEEEGLAKLGKVRAGRGRRSTIPHRTIEQIVDLTRNSTSPGQAHWSCRTMAEHVGVSLATVQRVWAARGLKPHLVTTFKLSNDPRFEEKLIDVVGLYLNPPDNASVLCLDEKSSVQALDRTQPSLPIIKGRAATMTYDYKRNGTSTLFAALDAVTAKVIGACLPRHRHEEFLKFLRKVEREVPEGLQVHLICDNYATHKHPDVTAWLAKHPRVHMHFTPASSSGSTWSNDGSENSPTKPYAAACSTPFPT